jgi:hypothetical protein
MKKILSISALALLLFFNCKTDKKETINAPIPEPELTILEKVANAHGFENWKKVNELKFTFNVDKDSNHFERDWTWNLKTNDVTVQSLGNTVSYNRNTLDSINDKTNGAFINDKFWLLAPYQLVWDSKNFKHELVLESEAPISKKPMQKLTIIYGSEGGYTPGDAYDFYFGDDYIIKEWVYRKGNQVEPSMITTWEDYFDVNGMKFAQSHKKEGENFNLHFTKIEVK